MNLLPVLTNDFSQVQKIIDKLMNAGLVDRLVPPYCASVQQGTAKPVAEFYTVNELVTALVLQKFFDPSFKLGEFVEVLALTVRKDLRNNFSLFESNLAHEQLFNLDSFLADSKDVLSELKELLSEVQPKGDRIHLEDLKENQYFFVKRVVYSSLEVTSGIAYSNAALPLRALVGFQTSMDDSEVVESYKPQDVSKKPFSSCQDLFSVSRFSYKFSALLTSLVLRIVKEV